MSEVRRKKRDKRRKNQEARHRKKVESHRINMTSARVEIAKKVKPNPAYKGFLIDFTVLGSKECAVLSLVPNIATVNLAGSNGMIRMAVFNKDDGPLRFSYITSNPSLIFKAIGFSDVVLNIIREISQSANRLEDDFPIKNEEFDNVVCVFMPSKVRDSVTHEVLADYICLEYSLGSASHEQFVNMLPHFLAGFLTGKHPSLTYCLR